MKLNKISKSTLKRLPLYLAYLKDMPEDAPMYISSVALADALHLGEVQVRRDLGMVSSGQPKRGHLRENLIADIEQFLGYDVTTNAVLIGAGKLGLALMGYKGFEDYGLNIQAAFDIQPTCTHTADGKPVYPMTQLEHYCRLHKILMGIITVPAENAQEAADQLIQSGVLAIWNFAQINLVVPEGILVQHENMATSLAVLSKHLQATMKDRDRSF